MIPKPSVLIIDRSEETREVLEIALRRRGMRTLSTGHTRRGLELARLHRPDLIVLDLEIDDSSPSEICAPFAVDRQLSETPTVMLGTVRSGSEGLPAGEFVSKPYHFGPLLRKIEELLDASGQTLKRSA